MTASLAEGVIFHSPVAHKPFEGRENVGKVLAAVSQTFEDFRYTDEFDAGAAEDPMLVFNVTDEVRETIQSTLYALLMQRQSVFR